MGCLFPCFGTCNHRKSWKSSNPASFSHHQKHGIEETLQAIEEPTNHELAKVNPPIKDSIDKDEEKSNGGTTKNEVYLDLNEETTHEEIPTQEAKDCCSLGSEEEKERESKEEEEDDDKQELSDSSMSSVFTYPPSHRHNNSTSNGDESEDDYEFNRHGDVQIVQKEEESSESLFSLSLDSRKRREVFVPETEEKEVNSPMTIDLSADEKMLRPIKLGSRIKNTTLAVTPIGFENQEKENESPEREEEIKVPSNSEEANLKVNGSKVGVEEEIGVETSLSSWLVGFGTKPISENSPESVGNSMERGNEPRKRRERAVLGEINGEIRDNSSASCFERLLDCDTDENLPIVGTIGRYWSHKEKAILEPVSGSSCKPRSKDVCV